MQGTESVASALQKPIRHDVATPINGIAIFYIFQQLDDFLTIMKPPLHAGHFKCGLPSKSAIGGFPPKESAKQSMTTLSCNSP
ncbi:hypothetical protein [Celeribacter sp.]|uniref:hypothetical protein n=1 Tax=Celeribacter sp. TaxID=1890673 RepID=UPI003A93609B